MSEFEGIHYKEILDRTVAAPLRDQIKIDFDLKNKLYVLSVPIFSSSLSLPESIKNYVEARKNHLFKPHSTSFQIQKISGKEQVFIVQQIAFSCFPYPSLRQQVDHFWKMARKCRGMLSEISLEEKYQAALYLQDSGSEF